MELALILLVVAFSFLVKSVVGFGGPLLAVPILAPFLGVEDSVVLVSLGNVVANLMLLWSNRTGAATTKSMLIRVVGSGVVGVALGSYLLTTLDDRLLSVALAVSVLVYIALAIFKPEFHISRKKGLQIAVPVGVFGGFIHGATGNSGTVFGTYLHALALPRSEYLFAITVPFLAFGSVQIATLASLGSFDGLLTQSMVAILPVVVVTPLGSKIGSRLANETFSRLILALLAFSGIALIASAVTG